MEVIERIKKLDVAEDIDKFLNNSDSARLRSQFWSARDRYLSSDDEIEKKKSLAICRYVNNVFGSNIPISSSIEKFETPMGFNGIYLSPGVSIGKNCVINRNVSIINDPLVDSETFGTPSVGNDVFIGAGVTIRGKVSIGNNCRIWDNAVVSENIPKNTEVRAGKSILVFKDTIPDNRVQKKKSNIVNYSTNVKNTGNEYPIPQCVKKTLEYMGYSVPENIEKYMNPSEYIVDKKTYNLSDLYALCKDVCSEGRFKLLYRKFKEKYQSQLCFEQNSFDMNVWFCDWILNMYRAGYSADNYFDFEFYKKPLATRMTFFGTEIRNKVKNVAAYLSPGNRRITNKAAFNHAYKKFINRDWLDSSKCSEEDFMIFCKKHPVFFVKPVLGEGGKGARRVDSSCENLVSLWASLQSEKVVIEELVVQHELLSRFNESSLNTLRFNTLILANGEAKIVTVGGRFGRKGGVVDNFHSGGIGVVVNRENGVVVSDGLNRVHEYYVEHPDSRIAFRGFQYPFWDKLVKTVKEIALELPGTGYVGWDIAITKNGEVELIEGNGLSGTDLIQVDQVGKRQFYEDCLKLMDYKY